MYSQGEAFEGLEPSTIVVGVDEVGEVAFELIVAVVVIALDGGFLDGSVHAFDLTVGPGVLDLGQSMLDAVLSATHLEHVRDVSRGRSVSVAGREGELDAVVGKDRMDLVGDCGDQRFEEGRR